MSSVLFIANSKESKEVGIVDLISLLCARHHRK